MNIEGVTSVLAVIVAFLALGYTIYQGYLNRKYQYLSVRPHIDVDYKFYPGKPIEVRILNNGLGPAIITKFHILFDKSRIVGSHASAYTHIMNKFEQDTGIQFKYEYNFPLENESMPATAIEKLLSVEINQEFDRKKFSSCTSFFSRLGIEVEYTCLFGKKFKYELPLLFSKHL